MKSDYRCKAKTWKINIQIGNVVSVNTTAVNASGVSSPSYASFLDAQEGDAPFLVTFEE